MRLRNFRSYGNNTTTILFREGLNVLLGRIGSGKSSILEAILIALFGFSRAGIKKTDVLRRDSTAEGLQIELTFFFEGMYFKVCRGNETRLETSPDAMSWTLVSEKSNEIDDYIESTLEVSGRKFRDLFYAAQGELTNVITGSSEERQKSIDKLLGAEGLRETYERLTEFVKFYDQDIGSAQGKLGEIDAYLKRSDLDEMRDQRRQESQSIIELGRAIESLEEEIAGLRREIDEKRAEARPLEEASAKLQKAQRDISEWEAQLQKAEFQIGEIDKQIARLAEQASTNSEKAGRLGPEREALKASLQEKEERYRALSDLRSETSALVEKRKRLEEASESLGQELDRERQKEAEIGSSLEASMRRAGEIAAAAAEQEKALEAAAKEIEGKRARIPEKEGELRAEELRANSIQQTAKDNAEKIASLNKLSEGAECPFCEQPISQAHRRVVTERIKDLIRKLLKEEESAAAATAAARKALSELKDAVKTLEEEHRRIQGRLTDTKAKAAGEDQNHKNLASSLQDHMSRRERRERELGESRKALAQVAVDLEALRESAGIEGEEWYERLQDSMQEANGERLALSRQLSEVDANIRSAEKLVASAQSETLSKQRALAEVRESAQSLESLLSEAKPRIAQLYEPLIGRVDDPQSKLSELIREIQVKSDELRESLKHKEIEKVELSGKYRQKSDQIAQLEERIEEYLGEQKRRVELRARMTVYSEAKNLLQQIRDKYKDAREMIRTNLINVLRETLRSEFDKLYAYEDFHDLKVSEDYEVSLEGPVGEIRAHNLSAGQKAIVSIAFRLAVAKAMEMRIGCWIIDEPTQNIGQAEVEALADVLADTREIPQIIVASHHEALARHGNVLSLGIKNGETLLGEGSRPFVPTADGQAPEAPTGEAK